MGQHSKESSDPIPERIPVAKARRATDERLRKEREHTDRGLTARVEARAEATDATIDRTRAAVDARLDDAKDEAGEAAREAAGEQAAGKAEAVVEQVAEEAAEALEGERRRTDQVTEQERDDLKHDFLEILARERLRTDRALFAERGSADFVVRSRDEVMAMISHDLRNYIHAIGMRASTLAASMPPRWGFAAKMASDIGRACETMTRWANDLVDISSIEAGGLTLERTAHDPGGLIAGAARTFLAAAMKKGVALAIDIPSDRREILCDEARVVQVMTNLLDNALKFTEGGGKITMGLEGIDGFVRFYVTDSGPGIPEEERANVFTRFWRARKDRAGGTGLGLFICKKIVEAHGGSIWVEPRQDGPGSTFNFTIPTVS